MPRLARLLVPLVAASLMASAVAQTLSPEEQRIAASVKANSAQALALLERAVNINSGTMNHAGVRAVGSVFRAELDKLGFKTQWIELPPELQRAGHLVATREGKRGMRVMMIGHLDTVFEADSPVQKWVREGDRVRGQGVNDMKGGDVIIIEALRALHSNGALDNTTINVIFTGDEENAGRPTTISRGDMVAMAKRSDVALAFEGAVVRDGKATGTIGRRSSTNWDLEVKGKQAHSQGVFGPSVGYGAIYETARILDGFRQQLVEPNLTFNPGVILGGTEVSLDDVSARGTAFGKSNVIANTTRVKGDLRFLTPEQGEQARTRMRAIVAQSLPGTSATIHFGDDGYPPMAPTAGNLKLLEIYSQASADAGLGTIAALPPGERGAGDVQFAAPYVDSLDGLGATGRGAHAPEEDLDVKSIEQGAIRTAIMLYRLTR